MQKDYIYLLRIELLLLNQHLDLGLMLSPCFRRPLVTVSYHSTEKVVSLAQIEFCEQ